MANKMTEKIKLPEIACVYYTEIDYRCVWRCPSGDLSSWRTFNSNQEFSSLSIDALELLSFDKKGDVYYNRLCREVEWFIEYDHNNNNGLRHQEFLNFLNKIDAALENKTEKPKTGGLFINGKEII